MSDYRNLPGVNVTVKDDQMALTQDNTSNSMLIIGQVKAPQSVDVPEEAVLVRNEEDLIENYGHYFYQGEMNPIAAEWYVAKDAGVRNIYLLGLRGTDAKENFIELQDLLFNVVADYQFSHIIATGMYADEDIEGLTGEDFGANNIEEVSGLQVYHTFRGTQEATGIVFDENAPTLTLRRPGSEEVVVTLTESIEDPKRAVRTLNDEIRAMLNKVNYQIDVQVGIDEEGFAILKSEGNISIEGEEILSALGLEGVNPVLEGYGNVAQMLGRFAEQQTIESEAVIVYIATKPPVTTNKSEIKEYVNRLVERNNENSKHVQVVAGPQVAVQLPGAVQTQWLSGITNYAILVNSLAVQNAPTNQPLPGVGGLRFDLSLRQLDRLTGNKYVTFRSKNNRIVVTDAVTTAPDLFNGQDVTQNDFTRLTTLRSVNYMVSGVRAVLDPFIGKPNEFPTYNAMNTAIKGVISTAIDRGVIQDAAYSIVLGDSMDVATVNMTILPQFELRHIDVTIGLSTPAGFEILNN